MDARMLAQVNERLGERLVVPAEPMGDTIEVVVRAGYTSGRRGQKAKRLGIALAPATKLQQTRIVSSALATFELVVREELDDPAADHVPFLLDVVAVHRKGTRPAHDAPLLFLGYRDFATLGERWRYRPGRRRS